MELLVIVFLVIVLLFTILREINVLKKFFKTLPTFMQFVPTWSFFAPLPNMFDYHLLYRGIKTDGSLSPWQKASNIKDKRSFFSFIWNPDKRFNKGLLDLCLDLIKFSNIIKNPKQICISLPYLQLLSYINNLTEDKLMTKIQFMIYKDSRIQDPKIVFVSEFHLMSIREK